MKVKELIGFLEKLDYNKEILVEEKKGIILLKTDGVIIKHIKYNKEDKYIIC